MVICLEDAIADGDVEAAHVNLARALTILAHEESGDQPLLFVRVREPADIQRICLADRGEVLAGIVMPKFSPSNGPAWFDELRAAESGRRRPLMAMPVLESRELTDPNARPMWLHDVRSVIAEYPGSTIALRIGAADIAGAIGLRRERELTTYAVGPLRDAISSIVGTFGANRELVPVISGCVWEHFRATPRSFRPQLRSTIFSDRGATTTRSMLLRLGLDILVEELSLDRAHGLVGKTAIHPFQVPLINAWQAVTHEEYSDARGIIGAQGASASRYNNKMNESRPHRGWAEEILLRSRAMGVLRPGLTWIDLLMESEPGRGLSTPVTEADRRPLWTTDA